MKIQFFFIIAFALPLHATQQAASAQTIEEEIQQQIDAVALEKRAAIEEYQETLAEFEKQGYTSQSSPYFNAAVQGIADLVFLIEQLDAKGYALEYSKPGRRTRNIKIHKMAMEYMGSTQIKNAPLFDKEVGKIVLKNVRSSTAEEQEKELARIRARKIEVYKAARQPQQEPATPERLQQLTEQQRKEAIIMPHQPALRELITEYIVEKPAEQCGNK